ncbi:MAG: phosphoglucomutase, alpha-D-glucose phosphate-specific [Deltaproteobacteria bacterium]|jgi:phosphoglucomutase|nr:phosphoglucomutase, alpha-D-glucose phosphate-specific [Deltaproteobacteria bacterium]
MSRPDARSIAAALLAYENTAPDPHNPDQAVAFGTSGHRGSSLNGSFTKNHILAITQAICEHRKLRGISGPLYLGKDTHALSAPALETALEVLAANEVVAFIQRDDLPTPTPVISRAIVAYNRKLGLADGQADGIVVTPSHNPPEDGGFKYNEPHGGPAGAKVTDWIEKRANALLAEGNRKVRREAFPRRKDCIRETDFIAPYVRDLAQVVNMAPIAASGVRLAADPLGGSALPYWEPIAEYYGLSIAVTNKSLDPAFSFMPPDYDGKIRMDCSSPLAMAGLISLADKYDLAFANDPDADRHGIVTPSGLMRPNDYLCAAVWYLIRSRLRWPAEARVGKTAVSTNLLNRICSSLGREIFETPVGFKWFVPGLSSGALLFGGEESAGASFLRLNGEAWTTDKDGILLNLLAAEMTAVQQKTPSEIYAHLTERLGRPYYARRDAPATAEQKKAFKTLSPEAVTTRELAGSRVTGVMTTAPGNHEPLGGLKVLTENGWFAARPSGTEDVYKIYAESFVDQAHLEDLQAEAQAMVGSLFG